MAECLAADPALRDRSVRPSEPPHTAIVLELDSGEVVALEVRGLTEPALRESIVTKARIGRIAE